MADKTGYETANDVSLVDEANGRRLGLTSDLAVPSAATDSDGSRITPAKDATVAETHGTVTAGTAATKSELVGAIYNSSAPTLTSGQQVALQTDASGNLKVASSAAPATDMATSGTIIALNGSVTLTVSGVSGAIFSIACSAWSTSSVQLQGLAADGTTWEPLTYAKIPTGSNNYGSGTAITANGDFRVQNIGAFKSLRATATAYGGTSISVAVNASSATSVVETVQINPQNLHANVSGQSAVGTAPSYPPVAVSGVDSGGLKRGILTDTTGVVAIYVAPSPRATYSAAITSLAVPAAATDFFTLSGSASKTIRVMKIEVSMTQTTGAGVAFQLFKRTAANAGGTVSNPTAAQHDSADSAASATVTAYTANPTSLGAGVLVASRRVMVGSPTSGKGNDDVSTDQGITLFKADTPGKAIVLRGTAQLLAINFNGQTATGNSTCVSVMWTEE